MLLATHIVRSFALAAKLPSLASLHLGSRSSEGKSLKGCSSIPLAALEKRKGWAFQQVSLRRLGTHCSRPPFLYPLVAKRALASVSLDSILRRGFFFLPREAPFDLRRGSQCLPVLSPNGSPGALGILP